MRYHSMKSLRRLVAVDTMLETRGLFERLKLDLNSVETVNEAQLHGAALGIMTRGEKPGESIIRRLASWVCANTEAIEAFVHAAL